MTDALQPFADVEAISRSTDLHALTQIVRRGRSAFMEVYAALARIKSAKLYKQTHKSWESWLTSNWDESKRNVDRKIGSLEAARDLVESGQTVPKLTHAAELAKSSREARPEILEEAERIRAMSGPGGKVTASDIRQAAETVTDPDPPKRTHPAASASRGTDSDERYTPEEIIEDAREVMGAIDLDPASCETAQATVKAARFHTIEDDGLEQEWHGRIWNNWPFSRGNLPLFTAKLFKEIDAGHVEEALVIVNSDTGAGWYQDLGGRSDAFAMRRGRINFVNAPDGNWMAQTFFYYGNGVDRFREIFGRRGLVGVFS